MSDVAAARKALAEAQATVDRLTKTLDQITSKVTRDYDFWQVTLKTPSGQAAYFVDGVKYTTKEQYVAAAKAVFDASARERSNANTQLKTATQQRDTAKAALAAAEQQEKKDQTAIAQNKTQQGGRITSAGTTANQAAQARDQGALTQNPPPGDFDDLERDPDLTQASNAEDPLDDEFFSADDAPVPATSGTSAAGPAGGSGPIVAQSGKTWYALDDARGGGINYASLNYIYKAVRCKAVFSKGQFTMNLEGRLMSFPKDELVKKNNPNAEPNPRAPAAQNNASGSAPNQGQRVSPPDSTPGGGGAAPVSRPPSRTTGGTGAQNNLQPQRVAPPTSNGQNVGRGSNSTLPAIQIRRVNGGTQTVRSAAELDSLFKQGQITQSTLNSGKQQLAAKQRSATATNTQPRQSVAGDGG